METKANAMFKAQTKRLKAYFDSDKALDNVQIDNLCRQLFGLKWNGANAQNHIVYKNGYQIVNTDTSKGGGVHWVGLYMNANNIYVYDSFARKTKTLLKILTRQAKQRNLKIKESKLDPEQFGSTEVCGYLSIAWLIVVMKLGIRYAMKI